MAGSDRERWDARYAAGEYAGRTHPTRLLVEWLARLPRGRALDVACGAGRNAIFLASQGYRVQGVDISAEALRRAAERAAQEGVEVDWLCADLDEFEPPAAGYELIVIARFLSRDLFPRLIDALAPGGYLVYESHLRSHAEAVGGPRGARFRLRPQELLHLGHELRVLHYFEGLVQDPDGPTMALAQFIGCRGETTF